MNKKISVLILFIYFSNVERCWLGSTKDLLINMKFKV
jgi:hypothetical protein